MTSDPNHLNQEHFSTEKNNLIFLLSELRSRLLRVVILFCIVVSLLLYFSNMLYLLLARPLLHFLPQKHLIATQIISPIFVPFKLAVMAAMLLTAPFFLYQLWAFAAPALYRHEKRMIWPFLIVSVILFYTGMSFAYFVIFPALFHFLAHIVPQEIILSPDIGEYLNFSISLLLIFGVLFEVPIIMVGLVAMNLVTRAQFIKKRSYAIIGSFVLGMLLAPPDVLSQTLLAIPIWILYEIGIVMTRFVRV